MLINVEMLIIQINNLKKLKLKLPVICMKRLFT
jgi:hypothetical protein